MRKKLLPLGLLGLISGVILLGFTLLIHVSQLIISQVGNSVLTNSYLQESRTPSVAEIEEFTRMNLPQGYRDLKALSHVETRDGITETMMVKLSANRDQIETALSEAGFSGNLEKNPEWRSVKDGGIKIPWWHPDAEKNVLSGYYETEPSTGEHAGKVWTVNILMTQHQKDPETLYLWIWRYCQKPTICK